MYYNFWPKLYFYLKFLEDVYFTIENVYQNFSNWHTLFVFFITSCSRSGMKWDTACRPTDDPFWAFLSPSAQEPVQAPNNICLVLAAEKNIYIGHSSKKDNHPRPLPQQGFCTSLKIWDELGVTWQTMKQRGFLPSQGPLNLNILNTFSWPFLDLAC